MDWPLEITSNQYQPLKHPLFRPIGLLGKPAKAYLINNPRAGDRNFQF